MSTAKIMDDFTDGLDEINLAEHGRAPEDERGAAIKDTMSSAYDLAALGSDPGDLWNWGMHDPEVVREIEALIPHFDKFSTDGFSEQLYFQALRGIPVPLEEFAGRSVLEVGCGIGGGLNFVSRCVPGADLVGLDVSPRAVQRATAQYARGSSLRFVVGDAEALPFDDGAFDAVINVESAHTYPNLGGFLAEVRRVLKPGGHFSMVDLFTEQRAGQLAAARKSPAVEGLEWVQELDISAQVRAAIRRRMAPGSRLRATVAGKRMSPLARRVAEHSRITILGGQFAGYRDSGLITLLRKAGVLPSKQVLPVKSYVHHVATKA
ncbi:class I SAM-dependent methyltransferase [Saccharopolyspora sp. NPDC000359]|uniref:class I SAM-dependent methyltransferase n=1 Tax=Saccharopolyspora sp. NPDC000359 TaxID=3154251 RepID=UPI0033172015